jgi:hypothetical protein
MFMGKRTIHYLMDEVSNDTRPFLSVCLQCPKKPEDAETFPTPGGSAEKRSRHRPVMGLGMRLLSGIDFGFYSVFISVTNVESSHHFAFSESTRRFRKVRKTTPAPPVPLDRRGRSGGGAAASGKRPSMRRWKMALHAKCD